MGIHITLKATDELSSMMVESVRSRRRFTIGDLETRHPRSYGVLLKTRF